MIEILRYRSSDYTPPEFSAKYCGFIKDSKVLTAVPEAQTDAVVRYEFYSPYSEDEYLVFVGEYNGDELVGVSCVDNYIIKNGSSYIEVPVTLKPGCRYRSGILSKTSLAPLTTAGTLE